jgi:ATP phosphoribosyltransferase regulatory subunit
MNDASLRHQLPHGVADLFGEQAAAKVWAEGALQETFRRWGYQRIILPTFEFYDSLATEASTYLQEEMYRLFDREGRVLALRPDMTVPTARVVGTRLYDQPLPMRLFYVGNVFRYEEPQAGRRREFTQAGIELVGAGTAEADAEVVQVAIAALEALGVRRFQINLGQVAFTKAMLSEANLTNGELYRLEQVIGRRNDVELRATLADLGIGGAIARAIETLPRLTGDENILPTARRLTDNRAAQEAIDRLAQVYALLCAAGVGEHVRLDLGEVRSMAYYTGITFQGYVAGLGFHVCSGGRYDQLISNFGPDIPAVGFALGVERAMLVAQPAVDLSLDLLLGACGHSGHRAIAQCQALAAEARAAGLAVEADILGLDEDALVERGRQRRARHVILCDDAGTGAARDANAARYTLIDAGGRRTLAREALEKEMATWSR